jgi:hypothetical protein
MRFGLVGTGPWAAMAHGPGLVSVDEVEFVGMPHLTAGDMDAQCAASSSAFRWS